MPLQGDHEYAMYELTYQATADWRGKACGNIHMEVDLPIKTP
jgi:hypothetical protein